MSNKVTDLTKLDFNEIRKDLKKFMENQTEFNDYDFDGSGLSVLLDVLSYNTQYNALLAHMSMNEAFLDTAQVRSNAVSHAQLLGYVPRSKISAEALVDITIQGDANTPSSINLPRGFKVSGKVNNEEYNFVTLTNISAVKLSDFTYKFFDVRVVQGTIKTIEYRYDGLNPFSRFEIPSKDVDMATLKVDVYENPNTDVFESYTYYDNINSVGPNSAVYYYQENSFGYFDIFFGDSYLGKKPDSGSKIVVEYIETAGPMANNIRELSASQSVEGLTDIVVRFNEDYTKTVNGTEKESLQSIQFNAPINFATQDRAVTANDYRILLLQQFDNIKDVSVWGGEDNDPPIYGKVFIAPALKNKERLTESFSDAISNFLKDKNVGAITPEISEAEYTNLAVEINFKFDSNKTNRTKGELESLVQKEVINYNAEELEQFDGILRSSNLLTRIDNLDVGILNSIIKLQMIKSFRPNPLKNEDYVLKYANALYTSYIEEPTIESNVFILEGVECKLADEPIVGEEPKRRIYVYKVSDGFKLLNYTDVGYIEPEKANVVLKDIKFDLSNEIFIYAKPDSFDIAPKFNQLVSISTDDITVVGELDSVSLLGSTGLSSYKTFKRH